MTFIVYNYTCRIVETTDLQMSSGNIEVGLIVAVIIIIIITIIINDVHVIGPLSCRPYMYTSNAWQDRFEAPLTQLLV